MIEGKSSGLTAREQEPLLSDSDAAKTARFRPHRQHTGGFFIAKIRKIGTLDGSTLKDR